MSTQSMYEAISKAEDILNKENIYAEVTEFCHQRDLPVISVYIEWGDWKHSHLRTVYLLEELGFKEINEITTEEDGSDAYSSVHFFLIP